MSPITVRSQRRAYGDCRAYPPAKAKPGAGYVLVKDESLTERSVLTTTNFIPVGKKFFLYQAAEYDLTGPGGSGDGALNYVFANADRLQLGLTYRF